MERGILHQYRWITIDLEAADVWFRNGSNR
jgi:hypothetical protein